MLWIAYLALAVVLVGALVGVNGVVLRALPTATQQVIRGVTLLLGLLIAVAAIGFVVNLASEPEHAFSEDRFPYYAFGSLWLGGLNYAVGTAIWRGSAAHLMRAVGWVLIVIPLTYPTTLTLALPLVAPLVLTVARVPPTARGERDVRHGPITARG